MRKVDWMSGEKQDSKVLLLDDDDILSSEFTPIISQNDAMEFINMDDDDADSSWSGLSTADEEGLQEPSELNIIGTDVKKRKKHKRKFFDKKKNVLDSPDIVTMSDPAPMENMVILEENGQTKRLIGQSIRYFLLAAVFFIGIFATYFLFSYRLVPQEIKGTEQLLYGFSVISRDYQLQIDELQEGDILMISNTPDWSPVLFNYELINYQSRSGGIIFATNAAGLQKRIGQSDIAYVLRGKPRL